MVIPYKIKHNIGSYAILCVFIILYLMIFYSFSGEELTKESFLIPIVRLLLLSGLIFILMTNIEILGIAYKNEPFVYKLIIIFFIYQFCQIIFNHSPISGIVKYLFFFSIIFISVFIDFNNVYYKIKITNNYIAILFFIIFGFYVIYMLSHPFSTLFRTTRINFLAWNNNENAGFFVTTFPFILFILRNKKILVYCFLVLFLYILVFYNGSLASIISSIIILFIYSYLNSNRRYTTKFVYLILIGIIIFIFAGLIIKFDSVFSGGLNKVLAGKSQEGNLAGRIGGIWIPVINYVSSHSLLFGFGSNSWAEISHKAGTFWLSSLSNSNKVSVFRDAHNFFLVAFVEGGIINLLFIIPLFIIGIRSSLFAVKNAQSKIYNQYAITVFCSWLGLFTWCMMYNAWYSGGWYFFTLLFSLSLILKSNIKNSILFIK